MKRLLIPILCAACCFGNASSGSSQTRTTTRSGFAVVTLVSGNIAGLIATEMLTNRTSAGFEQAVVAPSPLITTASMLVHVGPVSENTTTIAIANPSLGSGGVNLIFTDAAGTVVASVIMNLGPRGQFSRYLNDFVPAQPSGLS